MKREIVIAIIFLLIGALGTFFYLQISIRGELSTLETDSNNIKDVINTVNVNLGKLRDAFNGTQSDPKARVDFEMPRISIVGRLPQKELIDKENVIYAKYEKVGKEFDLPAPKVLFEKMPSPFFNQEVESEDLIYSLLNFQRKQLGLSELKRPKSSEEGFINFKPHAPFDLRVEEFIKLKMGAAKNELQKRELEQN